MTEPTLDTSYSKLRIKSKLFFKWFDFWIGFYIDRTGKTIYICPFPMFGIKIWWWTETLHDHAKMDGFKEAVEYIEAYLRMGKDIDDALASAREIVKELK